MTTGAHTVHMSPTSLRPLPVSGATEPYLDQLAHLVAEHGITEFEGDIARLVVRLRAAGLRCPTVDLLADKHASPIARERAFGVLLGLLMRHEAVRTTTRRNRAA
jgi:hypothetical protein